MGRYLPVWSEGSPWRSGRRPALGLPRQGWKIHVSATIANAAEMLELTGPILEEEGVHYKGTASIAQLKRLNCGLFYGYSQIGKFLTVYPLDETAASRIARRLALATSGMGAPAVPFEARVMADSPVFARYGLFLADTSEGETPMLLAPDGSEEPDRRDRNPPWAEPPQGLLEPASPRRKGLLATTFRGYQWISQRGKGGVYRALDLSILPARHCILKEGRLFGELDGDGNDGRSRLLCESKALAALAAGGLPVPQTYAWFEEGGNGYLAMEWIEGPNLAGSLDASGPLLDLLDAAEMSLRAARVLAGIHRCGWVWRDLKATNLLLDKDGQMRPIDFEGAARTGTTITSPWGSPGHVPPEWLRLRRASFSQDLYALGALIRHIFTCELPAEGQRPLRAARSDVPAAIDGLVAALMSADPKRRPNAATASSRLARIVEALKKPLRRRPQGRHVFRPQCEV